MNNAKLWLVVSPAVGLPIFLGAVAVGSFAVHLAVVNNTSWVSDFISGVPLGTGDQVEAGLLPAPDATKNAAYTVPATEGGQEVLVVMPDGSTATAILKPLDVQASATTLAAPINLAAN